MPGAPHKEGLMFYTVDTDLLEREEIEYLFAEYQLAGIGFWTAMHCKIFRNKYYWNYTERSAKIFATKLLITFEEFTKMLTLCLDEGIFDKTLFDQYSILTSPEIQRGWLRGCEKRKIIKIFSEYWLIDAGEIFAENRLKKIQFQSINSGNNLLNSGNNSNNSGNIPEKTTGDNNSCPQSSGNVPEEIHQNTQSNHPNSGNIPEQIPEYPETFRNNSGNIPEFRPHTKLNYTKLKETRENTSTPFGGLGGDENSNIPENQPKPPPPQKPKKNKRKITNSPEAQQVLDRLNQATGKNFRDGKQIQARLNEGRTVDECIRLIDIKTQDTRFVKQGYLDNVTPFRPSHFDTYLNQNPNEFKQRQTGFQTQPPGIQTPNEPTPEQLAAARQRAAQNMSNGDKK